MKTAVELLTERLLECDTKIYNSVIQIEISKEYFDDLIKTALIVEKENIINSRINGINSALKGYAISNEQYYNETYKNTNE